MFLCSSTGVSVTGHLIISTAVVQDAGTYSCTLQSYSYKHFQRAEVVVHVIYGKCTLLLYSYKHFHRAEVVVHVTYGKYTLPQ